MFKLFKNHYFIAFSVLVIALLIVFSNVIFNNKTLTTSTQKMGTKRTGPYLYSGNKPLLPIVEDATSAWHFKQAMQLNSKAYSSGKLPLWNPYNGAGQPLAADMRSASFYPLALPVLLNPTPVMWDFFLLLRLLAAGIFTFMFLRLIKINISGSIAGALTFMLSGYFVFFINMNHLNVEILLPLMLFSVEYLHQKKNFLSITILAISSALVIMGGAPEPMALNFVFAGAYFFYRSYQEYKNKNDSGVLLKTNTYFAAAIFVALLIAGVSWAPFVEYIRIASFATENKALESLSTTSIAQLLAPMFLGVQKAAYLGIIPLFLSIVTIKNHKQKWFFVFTALIVGFKVFGLGINWLGNLPIINKVLVLKYGQPLLALSIAILTAMAINDGLKASLKRVFIISAIWIGALYFFFININSFYNVKGLRLDLYSAINTKWAMAFLAVAVLLVVLPRFYNKLNVRFLAMAAILFIFLELWVHVPTQRAQRNDPYISPPFVKYLMNQKGTFRTYATNKIIWPNTNSVYKIEDIRSLSTVQPLRYMDYLSMFSDLRNKNHVTGLEGANLDSQFFDALNVRYVLTSKPFEQNLDYWIGRRKVLKIKDSGETWFKTPFKTAIKFPKDAKYLNFKAKTHKKQKLVIRAMARFGLFEKFSMTVRPGINKYRLNISKLTDESLRLFFEGDLLMNNFHFSNGNDLTKKFVSVYTDHTLNPPVTIYENKTAMPRVVLYDDVKFAKNHRLSWLKRLNIRKRALVETKFKFKKNKSKLKYKAKIISYKPERVHINVRSNKESLLVLADTYYPGWKAYVDGEERKIIKTNYLFRGVLINKNSNNVIFKYEPPAFRTVFKLTGAGILAMFALALVSGRKSRMRKKKRRAAKGQEK